MPRIEVFTGLIKFHESLPKFIEKQEYKKAILFSFIGFLTVKKEMNGRQHIVKATFNFLLIEVKFPTFLKASQYLNINSFLKMHNNMHLQLIVIVFYTSGKEFMTSTYYYVLRR